MMFQSPRPHQLVISGFHRSGTSLTAQYLHRAGLNLGHDLLGANPSNPDGHFEDQAIVALHKDILAANQRDWYTPGPDLSASADVFQDRAKALMKQFPADQTFGFKDPRSSLLLPWWHQQLDNPAAIIVFRHYAGCFHSLRNRQAQNLVFATTQHKDALLFWQQPTLALELWLSYNNAILDYVKSNRKTTLLVSHHAMLNGFNLPSAVNQTLGMTLDTQCDSGIRTGCQRPGMSENIGARLEERLEAALASLNALCHSEPEPDIVDRPVDTQTTMQVNTNLGTQLDLIGQRLDQLQIHLIPDETSPEPIFPKTPQVSPSGSVAGSAEHSIDVNELIQWGRQHQASQCEDAAEACWSKAHEIAPDDVAPLLLLAVLARKRGDNAKTVQFMQEAIQIKPENAGFRLELARALYQCGEPVQALQQAQQGLTLQHDHCELHLLQLDLLITIGNHAEAHRACTTALSLFPDEARFMKLMARLIGIEGDSNTAMHWFRHSVLTRIRKRKGYRKTLLQAVNTVPAAQRLPLSNRMLDELSKINSDAKPGAGRLKTGNALRLAMSILVRDEADVIRENILYHAAAGVDQFIVTDNGSIDGTREILEELRQVVDLTIIDEPSHTIDQDLWVTRMANQLRHDNSADWVINNDADEFWLSHKGSLKEAIVSDLNEAANADRIIGTLYCQRFNLIPSIESALQAGYRFFDNRYKVTDTLYERQADNPWHENNSNSLIRTLPGKVISRLDGLDSIDMGNHGAQHQHARFDSCNISIAHYPVRTYEQFERKVVNYGRSLANNSRFAPNVSRHLRFWYEQYQQDGLYQQYLKLVLPEQRLEQLHGEGIVCLETDVAAEIAALISSLNPQPLAIAS